MSKLSSVLNWASSDIFGLTRYAHTASSEYNGWPLKKKEYNGWCSKKKGIMAGEFSLPATKISCPGHIITWGYNSFPFLFA